MNTRERCWGVRVGRGGREVGSVYKAFICEIIKINF